MGRSQHPTRTHQDRKQRYKNSRSHDPTLQGPPGATIAPREADVNRLRIELVHAEKRQLPVAKTVRRIRHWERQGKVVMRDELTDAVREPGYDGGSNVVDVTVRALRRKLGDQASVLQTVHRVGYRFRI